MGISDTVDVKSKRGCKFGIRISKGEKRKAALLRTRLSRVKRGRGDRKTEGGGRETEGGRRRAESRRRRAEDGGRGKYIKSELVK
jgi:hypothetical protein